MRSTCALGYLLCSALTLALAGCAAEGASYVRVAPHPVLVDEPEPEAVRGAILQGLERRRFRTDGEEPGRIYASYTHGSEQVQVAIDYSSGSFAVRYLQSQGYAVTPAPDGSVQVDERCARVIDKLERGIHDDVVGRLHLGPVKIPIVKYNGRPSQPPPPAVVVVTQPAPYPMLGAPPPIAPPPGGVQTTTTTTTTTTSSQLSCCVQGVRYACPNVAAIERCGRLDVSACTRAGPCN